MPQKGPEYRWVTPKTSQKRDYTRDAIPLATGLFVAAVGTGYLATQGEAIGELVRDFLMMFLVWSGVAYALSIVYQWIKGH